MNFFQVIKGCFTTKYFSRHGRASRTEYWYFNIFCLVVTALLVLLEVHATTLCFTVVTFLPDIYLKIRRLHDINLSGHWILPLLALSAAFTICDLSIVDDQQLYYTLGILVLAINISLGLTKGTKGKNRFDQDRNSNNGK